MSHIDEDEQHKHLHDVPERLGELGQKSSGTAAQEDVQQKQDGKHRREHAADGREAHARLAGQQNCQQNDRNNEHALVDACIEVEHHRDLGNGGGVTRRDAKDECIDHKRPEQQLEVTRARRTHDEGFDLAMGVARLVHHKYDEDNERKNRDGQGTHVPTHSRAGKPQERLDEQGHDHSHDARGNIDHSQHLNPREEAER